jgi:serine/threonine protein phosphatase PrpC
VRELQAMSPQSSSAGDVETADDKRIVQALGRDEPQPSSVDLQLVNGDRILLASDGLNGELDDDELAELLASSADPASAAETLISAALSKGGRDNVSTIVVDVETLDDSREGVMPGAALPASLWPAILVGVLLALVASSLWWYLWVRR